MALSGITDEQIKEASWTVQSVTGASAYMHGVNFDHEKFRQELDRAVRHIKEKGRKTVAA